MALLRLVDLWRSIRTATSWRSAKGTPWRKGSPFRSDRLFLSDRLTPGFPLLAALLAGFLVPAVLSAQSEIIEGIEIVGNQSVDAGTYLFHITSKTGEPYNKEKALADFQRLWTTGFLDDLTLETRDGQQGKILRFLVDERERVRGVEYLGSKALSQTDIETKLQEEDAEIRLDSFYDPARMVRVEKILREMLTEKGLPNGEVSGTVTSVENGVRLAFDIRDEQKITIKQINFSAPRTSLSGSCAGV